MKELKIQTMPKSNVDFILWVRDKWNHLCPSYQKEIGAMTFEMALKKFQPKR